MTKQEVRKLMGAIRSAWPSFYKGADEATVHQALELWAQALEALRYEDGLRALTLLMRENRYPPTAAEVWQAAMRLRPQLGGRPVPVFHPQKGESHGDDPEH